MVIKSRKQGAFYLILIAAVLILTVLLASSNDKGIDYPRIKSANDISAFLSTLGQETDPSQLTAQTTVLPVQFDETFIAYNAIQIRQGCDLSHYAGKEVTVYTVPIINYDNSAETVLATVIVYKGKIIGGDIHAAAMDGFMLPLK